MYRISSVVSLSDVETFFKGWKTDQDGNEFRAVNRSFTVILSPGEALYSVKVSAIEDPSDSDEKVTDKPLEFIREFTGVGIRGACSPEQAAQEIKSIAINSRLGTIKKLDAVRRLRRLAAAIRLAEGVKLKNTDLSDQYGHDPDWREVEKSEGPSGKPSSSDAQAKAQDKVLDKIRGKLRDQGWKFHDDMSDSDLPMLRVDIGEEFEAEIYVESVMWNYDFSLNHTSVRDSGVSDEPLVELRKFRRSDAVKDAWERLKSEETEKVQKLDEEGVRKVEAPDYETIKPESNT